MTIEQWMQLVQTSGLGGLVAFLVYKLVSKSGAWIVTWLAPRVEKVVDGHITLVSALEKSVREDIDGHAKTHLKLDTTHGKLDEIHSVVRKIPPRD